MMFSAYAYVDDSVEDFEVWFTGILEMIGWQHTNKTPHCTNRWGWGFVKVESTPKDGKIILSSVIECLFKINEVGERIEVVHHHQPPSNLVEVVKAGTRCQVKFIDRGDVLEEMFPTEVLIEHIKKAYGDNVEIVDLKTDRLGVANLAQQPIETVDDVCKRLNVQRKSVLRWIRIHTEYKGMTVPKMATAEKIPQSTMESSMKKMRRVGFSKQDATNLQSQL